MKILVTGGQGQVGKEFAALDKPNIIALSRQACDITDPLSIAHAIEQYHPDIFVNAAAYTAVDQAETDTEQAYLINRDGVKNLALACRHFDIPLIHLSTDYVFDGEKNSAYIEEDTPNPIGVYGKSKLAGEMVLRETWDKHIIFRVSWIFGQHGKNFVKTILRLAKEREQLRIVADQRGCPTSARSIAEIVVNVCEQIEKGKAEWGIYHYCNAPETTWFEFAKQITALASQSHNLAVKDLIPITTKDYPTPAQRPPNSVLNCQKIQQVFGIILVQWQTQLTDLLRLIK